MVDFNPAASLKGCPFCGGDQAQFVAKDADGDYRPGTASPTVQDFAIACTKCPMATPWRRDPAALVEMWNRRPEPEVEDDGC